MLTHPSLTLLPALLLLRLLSHVQLAAEQSHFADWIEKDLAPWKGGITKVGGSWAGCRAGGVAAGGPAAVRNELSADNACLPACPPGCLPARLAACLPAFLPPPVQDLLEDAANMYDVCDGDMLRFQVLNGSLWVYHITDRWGTVMCHSGGAAG